MSLSDISRKTPGKVLPTLLHINPAKTKLNQDSLYRIPITFRADNQTTLGRSML
jgi:hypothetical protein